jgi:type VI secretion system protein VasG
VPYFPLSDEMLGNIIRLQLGRIKKRIAENHKAVFSYSEEVVSLIASRCTEIESGGRMIDAILTNTILPKLSEEYLRRTMDGQPLKTIAIGVANGDFEYVFN